MGSQIFRGVQGPFWLSDPHPRGEGSAGLSEDGRVSCVWPYCCGSQPAGRLRRPDAGVYAAKLAEVPFGRDSAL